MTVSKRSFQNKAIVLLIPLILYIIATICRAENLSNIFSLLSAYTSAGILLFVYKKSDHTVKANIMFLLYALACFAWAVADTVWAIISLSGGNAEDNAILWVIYFLTNCFLFASMVVLAINQYGKWELIQTVIDVLINVFFSAVLFWLLFFQKDISQLVAFIENDFTSVASILIDLIIDISIYTWFLSIRTGGIPGFVRISSIGLLVFTYTDITYYYMDFNGLYYPNELIDVIYIVSLVVISFGALWKMYKYNVLSMKSVLKNTGNQNKWIYLLIYPAFIITFVVTGLIDIQITIGDLLLWIIPIGIYGVICKYIQKSFAKEKELSNALSESERSKSLFLSHLPGMAYRCIYNREWTMQFISDGCLELTGYAQESLLFDKELTFNDIITPEYREMVWREWQGVVEKRLPFRYEYEITTAKGERKWVLEMGEGVYDDNGEIQALEGIILDISERKKIENNLRYISEHDTWTGLHNLRYLESVLQKDAQVPAETNRAVVGINVSTVHFLSRIYGYYYSQELIREIANALEQYCNNNIQIFNTYENHFVFYIKTYKDTNELSSFCESVAKTLESVLTVEKIGAGIGVVEIDEENKNEPDQLLKDLLIASEKALNRLDREFGYCFYDTDMETQIIRQEAIKRELAQIAADKNSDRLYLQFQPILDIATNRISGFEALARLKSDRYNLISPLEFIPIAEKTKLIIPLGEKIFLQAFHFLDQLKARGYDTMRVAINVSAIQLLRNDFVQNLTALIKKTQANAKKLGLEITESIFAYNYQEINSVLGEIKALGIVVAIDDFGTGYSSLARERELNVDCTKIDKFFVDKLITLQKGEAITEDIISMAHKLGHYVVAEGVETESQRQRLEEYGCDQIQGYLISKPLDEEAALEFLENQTSFEDLDL